MATWLNLFKNDKKTETDNQPLYRNVKVVFENDVNLTAGIPYEVALWKQVRLSIIGMYVHLYSGCQISGSTIIKDW